jgi:hypothetical protein
LYGGVCVYVLFVWLLEGFVKRDTGTWLVEAQENEVGELSFETHRIRVSNGVDNFEIKFMMVIWCCYDDL